MRALIIAVSLFGLAGCGAVYDWADGVGQHMPVAGERCEHWQCMTDYGKAQSEKRKKAREEGVSPEDEKTEGDANKPEGATTAEGSPAAAPAAAPASDTKATTP